MSIQEQNTTRLSNQNPLHNSSKKAPDSTPQHDAKMRRRLFAARAGFFTGGFTVASWAPIIPFVQTELSLEPAVLGTLLFGLGIGSFFGMPIAGTVSTRFGNRAALAASGVLSCLLLVVLAMIPGFRIECAALLLYGVTLGCLEVSANIYGAQLEKEAGHPLMSGLHAAYSVGEVVSAGAITGLLVLGVPLLWVVGGLMVVLAAVLLWALSGVSPAEGRSAAKSEGMVFAPARGRILMLSLVCMSVFLAEGAMLDWSAIYVHQVGGVDLKAAGVGYTLFVIAMAIARLMGDRMVERFGRARVLVTGMLLNIGTLVAMVLTDSPVVLFASLFVMGLGIANIAPVLISAASSVKGCDPTSAITTVTTIGYGGLMAGPALLGFIAQHKSLETAFLFIAALLMMALLNEIRVSRQLTAKS